MSAFLTVAEVETLTGYRRPSAQVRFLKARLYPPARRGARHADHAQAADVRIADTIRICGQAIISPMPGK